MKRINIILFVVFVTIFMTACPMLRSKSGNNSEIDDLRQQYIEACSDHNFVEARKALDKIEALEDESSSFDDHLEYVNEKEIYFLLADNSRDNANRIMYLYNTYDTFQLPSMSDVLEVAIAQDNEYLAEKLLKGGVDPDRTTVKAVIAAEKDGLIDLVLKKEPDLLLEEGVVDFYGKAKGKDALKDALVALWNSTPSNNEYMRNQIVAMAKKADISEFNDILAKEAMAEIEEQIKELYNIKIPTRPAIGRVKSDHYGKIPDDYTHYRSEVEKFNGECLTIINKAIDNGLYSTAKRVLLIMKPNLEWNDLGDWEDVVTHSGNSSVYNAYMVKQNRTEIEEAQRLIEHRKN